MTVPLRLNSMVSPGAGKVQESEAVEPSAEQAMSVGVDGTSTLQSTVALVLDGPPWAVRS